MFLVLLSHTKKFYLLCLEEIRNYLYGFLEFCLDSWKFVGYPICCVLFLEVLNWQNNNLEVSWNHKFVSWKLLKETWESLAIHTLWKKVLEHSYLFLKFLFKIENFWKKIFWISCWVLGFLTTTNHYKLNFLIIMESTSNQS